MSANNQQIVTFGGDNGMTAPVRQVALLSTYQVAQVDNVGGTFRYLCYARPGTPTWVDTTNPLTPSGGWQIMREDLTGSFVGRITYPRLNGHVANAMVHNIRGSAPTTDAEASEPDVSYLETLVYSFVDA